MNTNCYSIYSYMFQKLIKLFLANLSMLPWYPGSCVPSLDTPHTDWWNTVVCGSFLAQQALRLQF